MIFDIIKITFTPHRKKKDIYCFIFFSLHFIAWLLASAWKFVAYYFKVTIGFQVLKD